MKVNFEPEENVKVAINLHYKITCSHPCNTNYLPDRLPLGVFSGSWYFVQFFPPELTFNLHWFLNTITARFDTN